MPLPELKTALHRLVDETNDALKLQTCLEVLTGGFDDEEVEMTPEWEARLGQALQSVREGRYIPHEQFMAEMKEWRRKRNAQSESNEPVDGTSK